MSSPPSPRIPQGVCNKYVCGQFNCSDCPSGGGVPVVAGGGISGGGTGAREGSGGYSDSSYMPNRPPSSAGEGSFEEMDGSAGSSSSKQPVFAGMGGERGARGLSGGSEGLGGAGGWSNVEMGIDAQNGI